MNYIWEWVLGQSWHHCGICVEMAGWQGDRASAPIQPGQVHEGCKCGWKLIAILPDPLAPVAGIAAAEVGIELDASFLGSGAVKVGQPEGGFAGPDQTAGHGGGGGGSSGFGYSDAWSGPSQLPSGGGGSGSSGFGYSDAFAGPDQSGGGGGGGGSSGFGNAAGGGGGSSGFGGVDVSEPVLSEIVGTTGGAMGESDVDGSGDGDDELHRQYALIDYLLDVLSGVQVYD
jgi:hypothetical protein